MILKNKIWAFIPARSGSKSIINKNIKLFCGRPLIYYTFKILQKVNVDNIIFSTTRKYIKIANKFSKFQTHLRNKKFQSKTRFRRI